MKSLKERLSKHMVCVQSGQSVREAIELIRERKNELGEKFFYVYVTSPEGKLIGVLSLRDLLLEDPSKLVDECAHSNPIQLCVSDSLAQVKKSFKTHPFFALPVVDEQGKLEGVVSASDVSDLVQIETARKLHFFAGLGGEEIEEKSIIKIVMRRLPWLVMSIVSGLMCAYILGIFVEAIESMIALVLFIPIVLGLAGGVGVQSSVIVIRGLEEGKLRILELGKVLIKEMFVGLLIGVISCVLVSLIAFLWQKDFILGLALGASLVASVVASGLIGALLPLLLKAFRLNPELASGLFVLVICDIAVMIIYFSLSFAIINPTIM